jgi:hypothetical protein
VPQDHTCHKQFLELLLLLVVGGYVAHAHSLISATPAQSTHVPQDHQFLELLLLLVVGRYVAHAHSLVSATPAKSTHVAQDHTCHKQLLELLLLLVVGGYVAVMVQLPLLQVPVYRY